MSTDWGYSLLPNRPIFVLLCSSPEEQGRLARPVWFALTRKSTLQSSTELGLREEGQVVTVFKKGTRVTACKSSHRTGKLKTAKSRENWTLWASKAAVAAPGSSSAQAEVEGDSIHLQMMAAQVDALLVQELIQEVASTQACPNLSGGYSSSRTLSRDP